MFKKEIYLILDNIRSRENVGSIFRTADAAGISKIYLCGITPTSTKGIFVDTKMPFVDKIHKTALGAEMYVPWEYQSQTWRCLLKLKSNPPASGEKLKIVGLEQTKNSQNIFRFKPKFPVALVLGNEVKGLSPKILKYCDKKIAIPMLGRKESLNVSVAAGVALYTLMYGPDLLRAKRD